MQSETDYLQQDDDSTTKKAYKYFMRVDPDMRNMLGPIVATDDPVTGREMRHRWAKVAMIRGAKDLKEVEVYLDPFPHIRQPKGVDLRGWYSGKNDGLNRGERDRPCETDAVLTQPYGGWCPVGCSFCYINSGARGYRGTGLMTVPLGYGEFVAKQLASMQVSAAGYFSSFTDPFLPLEEYYHNSQQGAQAFVNVGLPIFFLSRLHYPGWAFDQLKQNKYSYAQKSINTPDEDTWHKLSPGAIPLQAHLDECKALHDAGIYISIQCNPIIPGVVSHEEVEQLFEMLAAHGVDHVIIKFVEAGYAWAGAMVERIMKKFPDKRGETFKSLFTENQCGQQRSIVESYRRQGHERYQKQATALGMTYSTCYEYTQKTGVWHSLGPEYLTADQCHGHKVPMSKNISGHFEQMEDACPPSGCLHCGDTHEEAPCGSEMLLQANALELTNFRHPWGKATIPLKVV